MTDNVHADDVYASITYPNTTEQNLTLVNGTYLEWYNISFLIPDGDIGQYSIVFFSNDTSNNINSTVTTYFTATDNVTLQVSSSSPSGNQNIGALLEIGVDITDNIVVNDTYASITYPNTTIYNLTLANETATRFNASFVVPDGDIGLYTIIFFSNDTSNNINTSETTTFTATDNFTTSVSVTAPSGSHNISTTVEIGADITDNILLNVTYASVSYPNGTEQNLTLTNTTTDHYNVSFLIPDYTIGLYTITFFANDSSGNANSTETATFIATDNITPQ